MIETIQNVIENSLNNVFNYYIYISEKVIKITKIIIFKPIEFISIEYTELLENLPQLVMFKHYDLMLFKKVIFSLILHFSKKYESVLIENEITSLDSHNLNFICFYVKCKTIVFVHEYLPYFVAFCIFLGLVMLFLYFFILLPYYKVLNYYYNQILPKFYYNTHPLLYLLNPRGFVDLDIFFRNWKVTTYLEDKIISELFQSAKDSQEHLVIYHRLYDYYNAALKKYTEVDNEEEKDIVYSQIITINQLLIDIKTFFRNPYIFETIWMKKYDFVNLYLRYAYSEEVNSNTLKKRALVLEKLRPKWDWWFDQIKIQLKNENPEIILLNEYLKQHFSLSLNDFENFDCLSSSKINSLYLSLWNNTSELNTTHLDTWGYPMILKLKTINDLLKDFLTFKYLINKIWALDEILVMTNMNRDNFYTDIDKLLTLLINKSAEAKLEHYRTLKKVEKEVIELKSYIYTNYKAPIWHPILDFIFNIVYPIWAFYKRIPFKLNKLSAKYTTFKWIYEKIIILYSNASFNIIWNKIKEWLNKKVK